MVNLFYEETEILDLNPEFFHLWFTDVCNHFNKSLGEVNIIFCSDDYLLEMNKDHLDHDYYTDIITFDYSDENISGDLFISIDRVVENADNQGDSIENERNRVCVHGLLHLLGLNDKSEAEKKEMTLKEDWALSLIVPRET